LHSQYNPHASWHWQSMRCSPCQLDGREHGGKGGACFAEASHPGHSQQPAGASTVRSLHTWQTCGSCSAASSRRHSVTLHGQGAGGASAVATAITKPRSQPGGPPPSSSRAASRRRCESRAFGASAVAASSTKACKRRPMWVHMIAAKSLRSKARYYEAEACTTFCGNLHTELPHLAAIIAAVRIQERSTEVHRGGSTINEPSCSGAVQEAVRRLFVKLLVELVLDMTCIHFHFHKEVNAPAGLEPRSTRPPSARAAPWRARPVGRRRSPSAAWRHRGSAAPPQPPPPGACSAAALALRDTARRDQDLGLSAVDAGHDRSHVSFLQLVHAVTW